MEKRFKLLPHTADIKMRAYGTSLAELFSNALYGMFRSIEPKITSPPLISERVVTLTAETTSLLLADFLSEALYLSDVHHEFYVDVIMHEITEKALKATLKGYSITGFAVTEIKAVTYHDLEVTNMYDRWQATLVFDI